MIDVVLDALAVYRLTRLVTADTITQTMRDMVIADEYDRRGDTLAAIERVGGVEYPGDWQAAVEADPDPPKVATLVTCRWCAGMWVALAVTVLRLVAPRQWAPLRDALAFSAAAALLARLEDD